ncbi:Crp/Fnr family transcriptional regulator [Saccharicrinis aurantiacus]|uniref:Crp/Fnr family transcriptional regulator n=1 Tax=Saccharicrinis aurantiacus TaxID=1849719 RepID=UPI002491B10C|nr:Crp/Fnr family transcriptional regulator [Saccharicrinis aurantiacus]
MKASLEQFFANRFTDADNEIPEVVQYFKPLKVAKDELLLESGMVCHSLYFIVSGSLKTSFIDAKGQETIRHVSFENQFLSSLHSFIKQTASTEFIYAIEASELQFISYNDFQKLISRTTLFRDFYIKMLETTYLNNHWRIETFLRLSAKERYEYLLTHKKEMVQRLSNKNLASYLGITQESLSRIKAKK